jgi:hypothetical protein
LFVCLFVCFNLFCLFGRLICKLINMYNILA